MNKHASKYFNTALLFDEALIELLNQKDIEYITVKEICKKAGVNRTTFYLHYENIDDLLNETIKNITSKFLTYFKDTPQTIIKDIKTTSKEDLNFINKTYLRPYLEFIKDNKKVFINAFKYPTSMKSQEMYKDLEKYIIDPILDRYNIPKEKKKYLIQFYFSGLIGIIKEWTISGCVEDIDTVINIIIECINK